MLELSLRCVRKPACPPVNELVHPHHSRGPVTQPQHLRPNGNNVLGGRFGSKCDVCRECLPRPELKPDVDEIRSTVQGPGQLLDAMIHQRLVEQGKAIVDFNRLNKLEEVIDELKRAIQSLR